MGLIDVLRNKSQKRKMEEFRDGFMLQMKAAGANEETLEAVSGMKGRTPAALMAAMNQAVDIMNKIRQSSREGKAALNRQAAAKTLAIGQAKLDPSLIAPALEQKRGEADIEVKKQVEVKSQKSQLEGETNFLRVQGRVMNAMNIFIDAVKEQKAITGLDPGFLSGMTINALQPFQTNKFVDALKGAFIQTAAASSRISLPGSRGGVRMLKIFEKTTINEGQTVESAIETSAFDLKNGGVELAANEPWLFVDMEKEEWQSLPILERIKMGREINNKITEIGDNFREMNLEIIFKDPSTRMLLREKTRSQIFNNLPSFNSEEEGDALIEPGRLYKVGDRIKEAS